MWSFEWHCETYQSGSIARCEAVVPKPSGKLGQAYCGRCKNSPGIPLGTEWMVAIAKLEASRLPRYLGS